jgi:hypothetical protein
MSASVFGRVPNSSRRSSNYVIQDVRMVRCANPTCRIGKHSTESKFFHHICFMHMMKLNPDKTMKMVEYDGLNSKMKREIENTIDMSSIHHTLANDVTKLIIPVCGKRCYNAVTSSNSKKNTTKSGNSNYAIAQSWDNDGNDGKRSSIRVLIDWLTTEPNCSVYFGGLNSDGRTNANRKETYHYEIRELIKKENGKYIVLMICYNNYM